MFKRSKGGIVIAALVFVWCSFYLVIFFMDWGKLHYSMTKMQTVVDMALLSSLRIRVQGLSKIADRWRSFGDDFELNPEGNVVIREPHWMGVLERARDLQRALPGYKGRIKAVITVVVKAHGISREELLIKEEGAFRLGIESNPLHVAFPDGGSHILTGGWYRRLWSSSHRLAHPSEQPTLVGIKQIIPMLKVRPQPETWDVIRSATGRLRWDVDLGNPIIQQRGNGGYPRSWQECIDGSKIEPFRYPFYLGEIMK